MNNNKLAYGIQSIRDKSASGYILADAVKRTLGEDAYAEAYKNRWIVPDYDNGTVVLNNNVAVMNEVRSLAEAHAKCKDAECPECKCKNDDCKCEKCEKCGEVKCKCPKNESRAYYSAESATYGLGNTDGRSTTPVPGVSDPTGDSTRGGTTTTSTTPATPNQTGTKPAIGNSVTVVENGRSYTGKIKAVNKDGKYSLSFEGERPTNSEREYTEEELGTQPDKK